MLLAVSCATTLEIDVVTAPLEADDPDGLSELDQPSDTDTDFDPDPTVEAEPTATPPPALTYDEAIAGYFTDVERFWSDASRDVFGLDFVPVNKRLPYDPANGEAIPDCGGERAPAELYVGNAFYCEPDDYIAWDDTGLFPDLYDVFGDFAVGLVIAHEYGHAMQARGRLNGQTIVLELHADCLAGAWAAAVAAGEGGMAPFFERDDLDAAVGGFLTFADPLGTPAADTGAHGTAFDRLNAFGEGFERGLSPCGSYFTDPPQTASILVDLNDEAGGDMALVDLLPLIAEDLSIFMDALGERLVGPSFDAPVGVTEFGGALGNPVDCIRVVDADSVEGSAYFCGTDSSVYVDRGELDQLWSEAGDFAPGYAVAHSFAMSVAASLVDDAGAAVIAADCLVGVWARDVFDEASRAPSERAHVLSLSAGDLDEGVLGLLLIAPTGPSLEDPGPISTFDRVSAFGSGFFRGSSACDLD
jgi:predicted metalloprotease